ncbi:MAG: hypothetical protein AAF251_17170 [Pseudomonadota bacterium]
MNTPTVPPEEAQARRRYIVMNAARFGGIGVTIIGLLAVRDVLPLPYALAVVLVLAGVGGFFFGPPFLVKRWKAQDRADGDTG